MGYIEQLNQELKRPGILGGLAMGAGTIAGGLGTMQTQAQDRARKDAQDRLGIVQKVGQIAVENGDGATAAALGNQMPGLLKQGYGIDVPNRPVVGAPIYEQVAAPSTIGAMTPKSLDGIGLSVGTPAAPAFGLAPNLGNVGAQMPSLLPPAQPKPTTVTVDSGRRDFNNAASLDASRKNLLIAPPAPSYEQWDPHKDVVDARTGKVVRAASPKATAEMTPYQKAQLAIALEKLKAGGKMTPYQAESLKLRREEAAGRAAQPNAASRQDSRTWAQHVADFGRDFPGVTITSTKRSPAHNAKVGGVPGSYHTKGMAFDAVVPPMAEPAVRRWAEERGMEVIVEDPGTPNYHWHFEPRGGVPAKPRGPRINPSKAEKPAALVANADGVLVPKTEGVQVKPAATPKPAKPFDEIKADKIARTRLGIKPGRMVVPSKKEAYDAEMAKLRAEHNRQNGGKTLLQTLMEMPD
jgi:hypothetical protein